MNILTKPAHPAALRSRARELKFFLPHDLAAEVRDWSCRIMAPDSHAGTKVKDHYQVTSLYFDTAHWDVLNKRGSYRRSKYRIRRYEEERTAFLERKIKTCGEISKWRSPVPLEDILTLPERSSGEWEGTWFQRRIELRSLKPVCRISYRRLAREGEGRFGRFRLTLDRAIYAEAIQLPSFSQNAAGICQVDCCPEGMMLELKFGQVMPAHFKQLIEDFRLTESPFSKYRSAVEKLGLGVGILSSHA